MCSNYVSVTELTSLKRICVPVDANTNSEDVLISVCKVVNIKPISRHLFGLRYEGGHWISLSTKLCDFYVKDFEFRIRFKVPDFKRLEDIDKQAFNYYFFQVRYDILCGRVKELSRDENKDKLLGLTVVDMYRFKLETGATTDDVLTDYKKFTPKEVINQHKFFIRKPIKEYLGKLENSVKRDLVNIKKIYLEQFEEMVPSYMDELFSAKIDEGLQDHDISILVCPYHQHYPGLLYCYTGKKEWKHLSTFEELCCISLHSDGKAEISRKNGIPIYLRMNNNSMVSFITHLDGYYRLSVKWTFNLCKDFLTPSLQFLQSIKCHGPIGKHFSYKKLEQKRRNQTGCFILRESETSYNYYYIDVCDSNRKTISYEIERKLISNEECFWFSADNEMYPSIPAIIAKYRNGPYELRLNECIPNSEYDISELLLCRLENDDTKKTNIQSPTELSTPLIVHPRNLRMFIPAKTYEGKFGITFVSKCYWNTKYVKMEVAVKCLKPNYEEEYLKKFIDLAGKWAVLTSSSVVRLLGVKLVNGVAMVSEFFPLGSLDIYLEENKSKLEEVDLVEAATYIASALLHMEAKGVVHGYLRCHKILVAAHTENCFIVRVSDPGIHIGFAEHDWHWIPPELYKRPEDVFKNTSADVWAFGTTLWQLFSCGENPSVSSDVRQYYKSGNRLMKPAKCSKELFKVLNECWHSDPDLRKRPQAAMRDINHFLYQVHNARRAHPYAATTKPIQRNTLVDSLETLNDISSTALDEHSEISHSQLTTSSFVEDSHTENNSLPSDSPLRPLIDKESDSAGFTQLYPSGLRNLVLSNDTTSIGSTTSVQSIMLNDLTIVIQGKIGKGFYGEVYKGFIEHTDNSADIQYVAVKKLITDRSSYMVDFEREIDIMKSLRHKNIVEMIGVIQDPEVSLIMEYVPYGSLKCYLVTNKGHLHSKNHLLRYASDVAEGMAYLGQKKIVHRDLAARNVLVADEFHVKISDFGLAQKTGQSDYYMLKTHRELPIRWYAPESLRDGRFSNSSDVWSYGVLLYEMFSFGEEPIITLEKSEEMSLLQILDSGARLHCPNKCPLEVYRSLMMPCWQMDSKQRPTFLKIIEIINKSLT